MFCFDCFFSSSTLSFVLAPIFVHEPSMYVRIDHFWGIWAFQIAWKHIDYVYMYCAFGAVFQFIFNYSKYCRRRGKSAYKWLSKWESHYSISSHYRINALSHRAFLWCRNRLRFYYNMIYRFIYFGSGLVKWARVQIWMFQYFTVHVFHTWTLHVIYQRIYIRIEFNFQNRESS